MIVHDDILLETELICHVLCVCVCVKISRVLEQQAHGRWFPFHYFPIVFPFSAKQARNADESFSIPSDAGKVPLLSSGITVVEAIDGLTQGKALAPW